MRADHSIDEIAAALGARVEGDGTVRVRGAAEPSAAGPDELALAMSPAYAEALGQGHARAAILWDGADRSALGLEAAIFVPRPRYAMAGLTAFLDPGPDVAPGIHPTAIVDPTAEIGEGAAVAPYVVIGAQVRIGPGARVGPHVSIARGARIGADLVLHAGVRIGPGVTAGDRLIVQPGASIGGDGFSFVTPERSNVEATRETLASGKAEGQSWTRIHSLGSVALGDDVEVGANATIDRGTIRDTSVGRGTKIDNLVMLAHNVTVGEDCLLVSQVGVAGSTRIGNRVVLGGKVGVSDNIFVGDDVVAGGGTNIYVNVPAGRAILGSPAVRIETEIEIRKGLRRLPRLFADVAALKKALQNRAGGD